MSPDLSFGAKFKDAILSNSALTDGLTDDEANPLINWAVEIAQQVGGTVADDADAETKQSNLNRLVMYISRFAQNRHANPDAEWVKTQIERLDGFNANLGREPLSDEVRAKLLNHADMSNQDVLALLMAGYGDQDGAVAVVASSELETQPVDMNAVIPETDPHIDSAVLRDAQTSIQNHLQDAQDQLKKLLGSHNPADGDSATTDADNDTTSDDSNDNPLTNLF